MDRTDSIGWIVTTVYKGNHTHGQCGQGVIEANVSAASKVIEMLDDIPLDKIPKDKRIRWRSFDDHGLAYYDGIVNVDWLYPFTKEPWEFVVDDPAYNVDHFNMDMGATIVVYNAADIRRTRPVLYEFVAKHERITDPTFLENAKIDPVNWLPLYGCE